MAEPGMARRVARGEIWLYRFKPPDKKRPVLIISRNDVIELLETVMVAPITTTRRGIPSELLLGVEHELKAPSAANLDCIHTVFQRDLRRYVSTIDANALAKMCRALAIATGCR